MFCTKCGMQVAKDAAFCTNCRNKTGNVNIVRVNTESNNNGIRCPNCGRQNILYTPVTTTNTTGKNKGFGSISACLGFILFGWIGVLCGLCGMGKGKTTTTTNTTVIRICQNCGYRF